MQISTRTIIKTKTLIAVGLGFAIIAASLGGFSKAVIKEHTFK